MKFQIKRLSLVIVFAFGLVPTCVNAQNSGQAVYYPQGYSGHSSVQYGQQYGQPTYQSPPTQQSASYPQSPGYTATFPQSNYQPNNQGWQGHQLQAAQQGYGQYGGAYSPPQYRMPQSVLSPQPANSGQQSALRPTYVQPIVEGGNTVYHDGVRYDTNAGIGLDQRTGIVVGGTYDKNGGFVGARGEFGAGLYGDASASQSGRIGNVDITNSASGDVFVGTEANARAGITGKGATVGAGAFTGGRAGGRVGTDVGGLGAGARGEVWSGAGIEAGANAGFNDGKLKFGGELGAGLGVGGKIGVDAEIDFVEIGQNAQNTAQNVGQWSQRAGQNAGQWTRNTSQNVGQWTQNTGNGVKQFGQNTGRNVGQWTQNTGNNVKQFGQNTGRNVKQFSSNTGNNVKQFGQNTGKKISNTSRNVGRSFSNAAKGVGGLFKKKK